MTPGRFSACCGGSARSSDGSCAGPRSAGGSRRAALVRPGESRADLPAAIVDNLGMMVYKRASGKSDCTRLPSKKNRAPDSRWGGGLKLGAHWDAHTAPFPHDILCASV